MVGTSNSGILTAVKQSSSTYIYFGEDVAATRVDLPVYIASVPTEHLDDFHMNLHACLERIFLQIHSSYPRALVYHAGPVDADSDGVGGTIVGRQGHAVPLAIVAVDVLVCPELRGICRTIPSI